MRVKSSAAVYSARSDREIRLTSLQLGVLRTAPDGWFVATDLARHAGRALASLVASGLAVRRADPTNLRRSRYRLTDDGRRLGRELMLASPNSASVGEPK